MTQVSIKVGRSGGAVLALVMLQVPVAPQAAAATLIGGERQTPALAYCGSQRAPLLELEHQYDEIENSRRAKAVGTGLVVGAVALFGNYGGNYQGAASRRGASGAQVVTAVGLGIAAGVGAYIALKSQGIHDRRALALAVDADAAEQLGQGRTTAGWARELSRCRAFQVEDFQKRFAASTEQKAMAREKKDIAEAVRLDIALTDKVVGHQTELAKTFTQARAMAEGTTETHVLGGQSAAYSGAGTGAQPLQLPSNSPLASLPPPPAAAEPRTVVTTVRATPVLASPTPKARVVANLPARAVVTTAATAPADPGWTPVTVNGQTGYTRAVNLSSRQVVSSDPNAVAPADNVREYNKVVLESRDEGPDRMRSLLTNFQ